MLTGTPLQNDLGELENLLSFLLPDLFTDEIAAQLDDVKVRRRPSPAAAPVRRTAAEQNFGGPRRPAAAERQAAWGCS